MISFTQHEKQIFELLMSVVKSKSPATVLRVAGGFVRDKLLGRESSDIDIAVSDKTGEEFAHLVQDYLSEQNLDPSKISVIKSNPEQSKHLATATAKILGSSIDFANLRSETYGNSRIPTISFGSPQEDAKRRDLTINALFYNINTEIVEDFVGGISDLSAKIARTPMDAKQTFIDDPLRILRTARFAAKYSLSLDHSIIEAAHDPSVQEAFQTKISQHRIWAELAGKKDNQIYKPGALNGDNPIVALCLLKQLGLFDTIFNLSKTEMESIHLAAPMVPWETEQNNPYHDLTIYHHTLAAFTQLVSSTPSEVKHDHETFLIRNIAMILHDIGKRYVGLQRNKNGFTSYHGHESVSAQMADVILNRLSVSKDIIFRVKRLIEHHLVPHVLTAEGSNKSYRKLHKEMGDDLGHLLDLARSDALGKKNNARVEDITSTYKTLAERIAVAISINPKMIKPISGKDLIYLGFEPGQRIGEVLREIDNQLLENPAMTKSEALAIARSILIKDTIDEMCSRIDYDVDISQFRKTSHMYDPSWSPAWVLRIGWRFTDNLLVLRIQ